LHCMRVGDPVGVPVGYGECNTVITAALMLRAVVEAVTPVIPADTSCNCSDPLVTALLRAKVMDE